MAPPSGICQKCKKEVLLSNKHGMIIDEVDISLKRFLCTINKYLDF